MKVDLEPAKAILRLFLTELEASREVRYSVLGPMPAIAFTIKDRMPIFDSDQIYPDAALHDAEEEAYAWMYCEAWNPRALMHRLKPNPLPDYYHQLAILLYQEWLRLDRNVIDRGEIIPQPEEDCTLILYLKYLETKITKECEERAVWMLSLKSFLNYLREDIPDKSMLGGLETIFPYKMDIREHFVLEKTKDGIKKVRRLVILRNILPSVYPIDIHKTAQIMKNLFKTVLEGRQNSQHSAAETLGFTWICHAAASACVITEEKVLFGLKISDLIAPLPGTKKEWFKPEYYLRVRTINGFVNVPISKYLYDYLLALPRKPLSKQIFCLPWRGVHRTLLSKGISPSFINGEAKEDNLSFLTLMSPPHHAEGQRYRPTKETA